MSEIETVLVVDDNRPLADGFAHVLSEEYDVKTAYSAADARELFDPMVDVVLLDRRLPDGSGEELLGELRDYEFDCRVAIVSADDPSPELDYDAYLTKPVTDTAVLHRTVADLLDGNVST